MDMEQQLNEMFETGMVNNIFYADRYDAVYQAFGFFSQNQVNEKDILKAYKRQRNPKLRNIPRIMGLWLIEKKSSFVKYLNQEILTFEDMLTFCVPIYHPDLIVVINSIKESAITDWFAAHLNPANSIKYFDELKMIFSQLHFEFKKGYPGYVETLCISFVKETADDNFLYQIAQNIQDRILEKGYMDYNDVKEIKDNGVPYRWLGGLMEQLDDANLQLFVRACIDTFDEEIVTEYMKYFYQTNNEEMINLLMERSYEIREKDALAFNSVKKFEVDLMFYETILDVSATSIEAVDRFEYRGSHITRFPSAKQMALMDNPFDTFNKSGEWLLVTSGYTNLDGLEMNATCNPNSKLIIWVIDNPQFVPKYPNIKYILGTTKDCINQLRNLMGLKV